MTVQYPYSDSETTGTNSFLIATRSAVHMKTMQCCIEKQMALRRSSVARSKESGCCGKQSFSLFWVGREEKLHSEPWRSPWEGFLAWDSISSAFNNTFCWGDNALQCLPPSYCWRTPTMDNQIKSWMTCLAWKLCCHPLQRCHSPSALELILVLYSCPIYYITNNIISGILTFGSKDLKQKKVWILVV